SAAMAARASWPSISSSAKPLHSPLKRSLAMRRPCTRPWLANRAFRSFSVISRGRPRTLNFSNLLSWNEERRTDSVRPAFWFVAARREARKAGCVARLRLGAGALQHLHLVGLHALLATHGDEAHLLAFLQGLETRALDGAEVDEQVLAGLRRDEAETLGIVEPLDRTGLTLGHCVTPQSVVMETRHTASGGGPVTGLLGVSEAKR